MLTSVYKHTQEQEQQEQEQQEQLHKSDWYSTAVLISCAKWKGGVLYFIFLTLHIYFHKTCTIFHVAS